MIDLIIGAVAGGLITFVLLRWGLRSARVRAVLVLSILDRAVEIEEAGEAKGPAALERAIWEWIEGGRA